MTSVSIVPRILARSVIAEENDAGISFTPPYGKSAVAGQMRHAIAAMQAWRLHNACTNVPPPWLNAG
jgi:hypothetical protein